MQTKIGLHGEVLRKAEITYTITGGNPEDFGYTMITDHNGELALTKGDIVYAVGEAGLHLGGIHISRRLGSNQQKDIPSDTRKKPVKQKQLNK